MTVEAWALHSTIKHGREIVEFRLAVSDVAVGQAYYSVRIDLEQVARLGRQADKNKKRVAKRGPIAVRRKCTWA